jgi:protocatechuate 3,4-dioxygenase alpha subunit
LDRRDLPLDPAFTGYGRIATQADGQFCFTTIKPGAVPFDERRLQAPHISVAVLGRGLLNHLYTRIYFDDESTTPTIRSSSRSIPSGVRPSSRVVSTHSPTTQTYTR